MRTTAARRLLIPLLATFASAQTPSAQMQTQPSTSIHTGNIHTGGPCSPVLLAPSKPITIECKTVGLAPDEIRKQAQQYADILTLVGSSNVSIEQIRDMIVSLKNDVDKAIDPYRITYTYTRQGWRKLQQGTNIGDDKGETDQWPVAAKLVNAKNWPELAAWAEREKAKVPLWFEPLYFAASAYGNLCQHDKEMENLDAFIEKAQGVEDYGEDVEKAKTIKAMYDRGITSQQCSK